MPWIRQSKRHFAQITRRVRDLLYPPGCACCRSELDRAEQEGDLCEECKKRLIPRLWISCPRCGGAVERIITSQSGCISCSQTSFHFDSVVALGSYHPDLKQIISRMKFENGAPLALAMGKLLSAERGGIIKNSSPDVVIPIPMHWMHRLRRRVNSPELIAGSLAQALGLPLRRWVLLRSKRSRTQSELPPQQRYRNVKGVFRVRFAQKIRGRRILLIDDVLTTGATCSEAAKVLKQAGAAMVAVAVVARAQGER